MALRLYDDRGLLRSADVDLANGYRYYSEDQVDAARLIGLLRGTGMSLNEIGEVLTAAGRSRQQATHLLNQFEELESTHSGRRLLIHHSAEKVGHFGDDEGRHDQWSGVRFEQVEARSVVPVVAIDVRVQRAGVDDQCDEPTSLARISSIRSEMSLRPLAPAPAASSRRFPCGAESSFSIAFLVSSDTGMPRRSASCRSRASRSSGSLTVVRCMYADRTCRYGRSPPVSVVSDMSGDQRDF